MLKEGLTNGISLKEFKADENKYIFKFDFDLATDSFDPQPTTEEELIEAFNKQCNKYNIPYKIIKVMSLIDSATGRPYVKGESTKPMTPNQLFEDLLYPYIYGDDADSIYDQYGIEVVKICN